MSRYSLFGEVLCPQGNMGWSEKGSLVCLLPSGSLLLRAGTAKPSTAGSLGMRCFSAETWAPDAVWTLTADNIAQVLHLPVRMPAPLGTLVLSTVFTLALGHTEASIHVYQECYLRHYLPSHVLFPFPSAVALHCWQRAPCVVVLPASRWEVGHKAFYLSPWPSICLRIFLIQLSSLGLLPGYGGTRFHGGF